MDSTTVISLRQAIACVFERWEQVPTPISDFEIVGVMDTQRDRYALEMIRWNGTRRVARPLAYMEITDGKIHVKVDNTEEGIAVQLADAGIPKMQIALAFYPAELIEPEGFAVSSELIELSPITGSTSKT